MKAETLNPFQASNSSNWASRWSQRTAWEIIVICIKPDEVFMHMEYILLVTKIIEHMGSEIVCPRAFRMVELLAFELLELRRVVKRSFPVTVQDHGAQEVPECGA